MYSDWFKLKKLPFRLRPDPEFLYLGGNTGLAYESLHAAVLGGQRLVRLIGESGVGKTTLLHTLAGDCRDTARVARVQQPSLTSEELTSSLLEQFGQPPADDAAAQPPLTRLRDFMTAETAGGRAIVILVDEAHRCSSLLLRDLLVLTTWPVASLVVLAGEEEVLKSLAAIDMAGMSALRGATLRLERLLPAQIAEYVHHRLAIAGAEGRELFEPDTMGDILRYTGGLPQLINTLCDSAMSFAAAHSAARVSIIEIRDAARELNWIEFSARSALTAAVSDTANSARPRFAARVGPLALEVHREDQLVAQVPLVPGRLLIGRSLESGLRLDSRFVSRRHCQIVTTADQIIIEDLGSANGMLVNGKRSRLHHLAAGDSVKLGDYTLRCVETPALPES